jgi:mediator of RNA polymerase II transcription subunit 17
METMFALDFVSLLLSKQAPRQAETSMSAFLKQVAPLGSLNAEVVHPPPKPESTTKDVSAVSRGWRTQNFNAAANKLLQAASRLETEVASETRYWNEVLAVKDKGWKVSRLPIERQSLGVQYGFIEGERIPTCLILHKESADRNQTQRRLFSATAALPPYAEPRMGLCH